MRVRNLRDFVNFLEFYRFSFALSQYQMSKLIGVDPRKYNKLVKCKMNISLNKMIFILNKIDSHVEIYCDLPF